jgi:galactoside O-acetyltransferase
MLIKLIIKRVKRLLGIDKRKSFQHLIEMSDSFLQLGFNIIAPFAGNRKYVKIGKNCMLDCNIYFESSDGNIEIGDNVYIGNSTLICRNKIVFENNVFVAWGCYFYDHDSHSTNYLERRKDLQRQIEDMKNGRNFIASKDWSVVNSKPIHVSSDAWIGMNSIILKGVRIGRGAIVAAGSVVIKDVPDWTVVAGNPAKVVKQLEENNENNNNRI